MADYPTGGSLFEGETFKGDLKTHFDTIYKSGDFQRLIRAVAAEHFGLPADVFKEGFGRSKDGVTKKGSHDITSARKKLIYVLKTFLVKNDKEHSPQIIGRKFGRTADTITQSLDSITDELAKEAEQGQTALRNDLLMLSMKITMQVMKTSPLGKQSELDDETSALFAPTRPQGNEPTIKVDPTQVARKG